MIWIALALLFGDGSFVITERGYSFVITERAEVASATPATPARLVRQQRNEAVRYLVSEDWCINCPAAKRRFIESGGSTANIITIRDADRRFGIKVDGIPHEFTRTISKAVLQAPSYRSQWPPKWDVLGNKTPTKSQLLGHLRSHPSHIGKHWQRWYLEVWERDQLAALHDDDHDHRVPVFSEPE